MNRIPISFTKAAKGALALGHKDVYQRSCQKAAR